MSCTFEFLPKGVKSISELCESESAKCSEAWRKRGCSMNLTICSDCGLDNEDCLLRCMKQQLPAAPLKKLSCVGGTCADAACADALECNDHGIFTGKAMSLKAAKTEAESRFACEDRSKEECKAPCHFWNDMCHTLNKCDTRDETLCENDTMCVWDTDKCMDKPKNPPENPPETLARVSLSNCPDDTNPLCNMGM